MLVLKDVAASVKMGLLSLALDPGFSNGMRKLRSPTPSFQRYPPGSTTEPPKRTRPGRTSLTDSTTSRRRPLI